MMRKVLIAATAFVGVVSAAKPTFDANKDKFEVYGGASQMYDMMDAELRKTTIETMAKSTFDWCQYYGEFPYTLSVMNMEGPATAPTKVTTWLKCATKENATDPKDFRMWVTEQKGQTAGTAKEVTKDEDKKKANSDMEASRGAAGGSKVVIIIIVLLLIIVLAGAFFAMKGKKSDGAAAEGENYGATN